MRLRFNHLGCLVFLLVFLISTGAQAKDNKRRKGRATAQKPRVERCADCIDYLKIREEYFIEQEYDEDGLFDEDYYIRNWNAVGKYLAPTIYYSPLCTGTPYDFA